MKRFVIATALTCVLSVSAYAGVIPMDLTAPPPPEAQATSATSPGDLPTCGLAQQLSDAALSGLLSVLSLAVV